MNLTTAQGSRLVTDLEKRLGAKQYFPDLLARGVDVSLYLAESLTDSGLVARRLGISFEVLCASPEYLNRYGEPVTPAELGNCACLRLVSPSIIPEWRLTSGDGRTQDLSLKGPLVADNPELLRDVARRRHCIASAVLGSTRFALASCEECRQPGARLMSAYMLLFGLQY